MLLCMMSAKPFFLFLPSFLFFKPDKLLNLCCYSVLSYHRVFYIHVSNYSIPQMGSLSEITLVNSDTLKFTGEKV